LIGFGFSNLDKQTFYSGLLLVTNNNLSKANVYKNMTPNLCTGLY